MLYLAVTPPSTLMLARWVTGRAVQRIVVPLTAISPFLPAAVIASEDARFCQHHGVDWDALSDVVDDMGDGGPARGASTITMQTAKNVFLWSSRSYIRKAIEIPLALYLDLVWGKRRTMEI
ncbi:MAG TPA: biosynthetic peptidoglycan transglycosylase, partial [Enterovirga sp.]